LAAVGNACAIERFSRNARIGPPLQNGEVLRPDQLATLHNVDNGREPEFPRKNLVTVDRITPRPAATAAPRRRWRVESVEMK
jgi:hypothetical protein